MNIKEIPTIQLIERIALFDDSVEIVDGLKDEADIFELETGEYAYYAKEGAEQIEGMWEILYEIKRRLTPIADKLEPQMRFNGSDYSHERDSSRLSTQYWDIYNLMRDSSRRTLHRIERLTGHPPASVSAQLRHMRKGRFGGHTVNKHYLGNGLYEYELIVNREVSK
tara:strand:+ start:1475 stop:1975 length:501 start_codon:yes stop_codon:yes gene_type:complete